MEWSFKSWEERINNLEKIEPRAEERLKKIEEVLKTRKELLTKAKTELEKKIINIGTDIYLNALNV